MRKRDKDLVEQYAHTHGIAFQALKDLYELCMKLQNSAWVDGVNDVWPGDEEE